MLRGAKIIIARREKNYCAEFSKSGFWKIIIAHLKIIIAHLKIIIARLQKIIAHLAKKNPPTRAAGARKFVIFEVKPGYILSKFRAIGARKFCDFRGKIRRYFIKISRRRREKILRF